MKKCFAIFLMVLMCPLAPSLSGCRTVLKNQEGTGGDLRTPSKGMVLIPAGEFQIDSTEAVSNTDERLVCTVYVDAFYIDETEVTNAQFKEFLIENPCWQKGQIDPRFCYGDYLEDWKGNNYPSGQGDDPVVDVSWYAAMAYSEWAGKRLPTEAEWERTTRRGLADKKYARVSDQESGSEHIISQYPEIWGNKYGLRDTKGSVWEWCLDEYDSDFSITFPRNEVARNPVWGAPNVAELVNNVTNVRASRVLRGGSWHFTPQGVWDVDRMGNSPMRPRYNIGFRCVRDISP